MEYTALVYRDFYIFGIPGYYRFESRHGVSVSVRHWKTLNGVRKAIDREYRLMR